MEAIAEVIVNEFINPSTEASELLQVSLVD
jgi:hypothetical protein